MWCWLTLIICVLASQWHFSSASDTNGFTEVLSTDGAVTVPRDNTFLYLFFSVNFTSQVEVTSFTLIAQDQNQMTGGLRDYPRIQIWRRNNDNGLYDRIHSVGTNTEVTPINSSLYVYTPISGSITVNAGDILGLSVPIISDANILPYFLNSSNGTAPTYYESEVNSLVEEEIFPNSNLFRNQYSPLVAVEIMPSVSLSSDSPVISSTSLFPPISSSDFSSTIPLTTTTSVSMTTTSIPITTSIPMMTSIPMTTSTPMTSSSMVISNTPVTSSTDTMSIFDSISSIFSNDISSTTLSLTTSNTISLNTLPTSTLIDSSSLIISSSLPSSSPSITPLTDGDPSPISAAVIGGLSVAGILILIIIGLVFILVLLFGVGKKKRGKKRSFSPAPVDPEPLDNPNYSAVSDNGVPPSMTSTLTGDRFVTHYEIPGYQDPLGSPPLDENHYDQATNGIGITAFYDEARRENGADAPIYHDTGDWSHYEMNEQTPLQSNHYEMNSDFIYDSATGVPSGYEKPVISRSNTMKGGSIITNTNTTDGNSNTMSSNQYDVIPDDLKLSSNPLHKYSVITTTEDIFVPTEEERLEMSHSHDSERLYSHLEVRQKQRYENVNFFEETDIYWRPATDKTVLYEQLARRKYREIRLKQLRITKHLGSGQFGTVNEGVWQSPNGIMGVAIKMLAENSDEEQKIKLLQEAAIMGQFCHPNVIRLHGVVTVGEPIMIVMDLMNNGDLRNYLHLVRSKLGQNMADDILLPEKLLEFCKQIAKGMHYLSKKSFVHRDLAARNIFLDDDYICKIGDFGMSRDLEDENYYISQGGQVPIKWTAPEALQYKRYAPPSDVWSYGAVLYEIWSLGHKPFEGFSNPQAVEMVQSGYRLPPPPGCPRAVYQLMIHCWHPDSSRRPNFADILQALSEDRLLSWRDIDKSIHPQACELGAALEAGQDLYPELQQTFVKSTFKR